MECPELLKVWRKGYIGVIGDNKGQYYYRADENKYNNTLIKGLLLDPIPMVAILKFLPLVVRNTLNSYLTNTGNIITAE